MTPAIHQLEKLGVRYQVHTYQHDPACTNYGSEVVTALQLGAERVFKTLVVMLDQDLKRLAVAIIPVEQQLNLKVLAGLLKAKKAAMAPSAHVEKVTGYVLGGVSPIGQKKTLPTLLDQSALEQGTIFVSGGRRGLELELAGQDLISVCQAKTALLCR